jgi:predicted metal-dependent hydrolase
MTTLHVRRLSFQFDEATPFQWNRANPLHGLAMNAVSFVTPSFERYIIAAVHKALPYIVDAAVREEADLFLRQEAVHAQAHRNHAAALVAQYPGLAKVIAQIDSSYDQLLKSRPLRYHLAYVADIEATFTPMYDLYLRHRDTLFDNGDPRVASLFLWHFVEEIEHRSSALNIYNAMAFSPWYRLSVMPSVFAHIRNLQRVAIKGFKDHVSAGDLGIDYAEYDAGPRVLKRVRRSNDIPGRLMGISGREKLVVLYRLARSQWPGHVPAAEQTPPFADEWLEAYAAGKDVVDWYGNVADKGGKKA